MFRFQWSKEALNYLNENRGLVDELELAFAEFRAQGTGVPVQGVVEELAPLHYLWGIQGRVIMFRHVRSDSRWIIRVEVIKPVRSLYDELLLGR